MAVYLLISIGGIVRSTGSGMGCPDWPTCFGKWVPPTSVEELPDNYKEIYSEYRHRKNVRFASYLERVGLERTAAAILNDKSIRNEADFNAAKTWIEYMNRLAGVVVGILIFALAVSSVRFRKSRPWIMWVALATLLLVGFQGWIGSIVVSTNLTPWTVTVHMFLALVIVALLVYLVHSSAENQSAAVPPRQLVWWLSACIVVLLIQILLGTNVRESIDQISSEVERTKWITTLGREFVMHRTFSWVVLGLHASLMVSLWKTPAFRTKGIALLVLLFVTIVSGIGMAYFGVPAYLQPVHLLLATMSFGIQVLLFFQFYSRKQVATI